MEQKRSLSEEFKQPPRRSSGGTGGGGGVDGSTASGAPTTTSIPATNSNGSRKSFYFSSENIINSNNNIYQNELKELTKIEQEITLNLQEIDKNLSITNKLINEKILKNLIKINKNSSSLFKNLNFWKLFFENSANVEIVTNDIDEEEADLENNQDVENERSTNFNDTTSQSDFESLQRNYQLNLSNLPNMDSEITGNDTGDKDKDDNNDGNKNNNDTSSIMNLGDSFWKDPTKTRKNLTSSTPNRELVGIRTDGTEDKEILPPPPVPNFGRSNSDTGNIDEGNDSEILVIPSGLQYALGNINNDKNVTNNSGTARTSKWKLQQSPRKSISEGDVLDDDSRRSKKRRRRSSIVGSVTPKRRVGAGAGSGDTMTMAARYNSSPEEEPPVLESDIYFSPLRKKNDNNDENGETPLSKAARLNIEKSDIQRFPKSPKYGAGGVLLRSNIGHQVALNFAKSQLVKSNSSLGPGISSSSGGGNINDNNNEGLGISNELKELENDGGTLTRIFLNQQNDSTTFDETPDLQVEYMDYQKEDNHNHDEERNERVQEKAKENDDEDNNSGTGILPDTTETGTTTKIMDASSKSIEDSEKVGIQKGLDGQMDKIKEIPVNKSDDSKVNKDREPNPFLE
ncbi:unnamed protein product [[Candida] boidinii]|uniref:DASH complex subunit ASK1 n=1 Tax=Candida boidinii TaxID=5477 RepID=A0A9W6SV06_CANBO|nr:hypothetical protein B5S30_g597 [[Candida] boidinii]GME66831.1 unnamed protein product [[Candida] boidinii]GMF98844.1 unnamed protein product [[Candida] boidinii]